MRQLAVTTANAIVDVWLALVRYAANLLQAVANINGDTTTTTFTVRKEKNDPPS